MHGYCASTCHLFERGLSQEIGSLATYILDKDNPVKRRNILHVRLFLFQVVAATNRVDILDPALLRSGLHLNSD